MRIGLSSSLLSSLLLVGAVVAPGCRGDAPAPTPPAAEDATPVTPEPATPEPEPATAEPDTAAAAPDTTALAPDTAEAAPSADAAPTAVAGIASDRPAPSALAALHLDAPIVVPVTGETLPVPTRRVEIDGGAYDVGEGARVEALVAAKGEAALVVWRGVTEADYVAPPPDHVDWGTRLVDGRVPTHNASEGWGAFHGARLELLRLRRDGDAWGPVGEAVPLGFRWGSPALAPRASVDLVPGQWALVTWWAVECGSGTSTCHPYRGGQAVRLTAGGLGRPVAFPGAELVPAYGEDLCQLHTFGYLGSFADFDGDGALDLRIRATHVMVGCDANEVDCLLKGRERLREPGIPLHYLTRGEALERVEKTDADLVESALIDTSPPLLDQAIAVVDYAARTDGDPSPAVAAKAPAVFATFCAVDTMEGPKGGRADVPAMVARIRAAKPSAAQEAALAAIEAALADAGGDPE